MLRKIQQGEGASHIAAENILNRSKHERELRNNHCKPRGRARRPHQHAMPAVQTLPPMPVPAVQTVPVPTAAPVAAMASMAVASAVAADADLVLTRTIAPRRVRTTGRLPARGARKRAKYRERSPLQPESGGGMGAMGAGRPPWGGFSPQPPPRAGGRKESPYGAELVSGGGPFFRAISTEKEIHADHHDEHRGHPPV